MGTSFIFSHDANLTTLEGDPRFLFDDSLTPQAQGTGTEEWAGGDSWGWAEYDATICRPSRGSAQFAIRLGPSRQNRVCISLSACRSDAFAKRAVIRLENGGTNESEQHYEAVTYIGMGFPFLGWSRQTPSTWGRQQTSEPIDILQRCFCTVHTQVTL